MKRMIFYKFPAPNVVNFAVHGMPINVYIKEFQVIFPNAPITR